MVLGLWYHVSMYRIWALRHGNVENPEHVIYGRLPGFNLSELGKKEAYAAAKFLSDKVDNNIPLRTSPLLRALATADVLISFTSQSIITDERLAEVWQPILQGRPEEKYDTWLREQLYADVRLRNETFTSQKFRMRKLVNEVVSKYREQVFISHQDPLQALIGTLTNISDDEANNLPLATCGIYLLESKDLQRWSAEYVFEPKITDNF